MAELKPCPFCGGKNIVFFNNGDNAYCYCEDCGTEGPWFWANNKNPWNEDPTETLEEFAIKAWNRRVDNEP